MKILQITNYFYPAISFGGPVQYTYNLSKYLTKLGHEVTVYTTNALELHTNKKISNKRKKINGIDVHYLPFIIRPYGYFIVPEIISKILKNVKLFDIVHLHEYRTFQNMIFYLFKKDIPYVVHLHGELLYKKEKLDVFLLRRTYENLFTNKFLNCASRIFALTKYEFSQLVKLGYEKRKISIVPNAVSPDRFIITPHKNTFKKYFNIENNRIILYVGRIYKY
ncbi:MAG: glycosyltransferase family 4 protein, partial [Candidatus Hodarchaeota archaeon]